MADPDLLAELDAASITAGQECWCGRHPEDCEDAGGCAFTRHLAAVAAARDEEIARLREHIDADHKVMARAQRREVDLLGHLGIR